MAMSNENPSVPESDFIFLREEIRHEDNLINQRLSWLVSSQSFLLTGFAIGLNGPAQSKFALYERLNTALVALIPIAGILVCLVCYATILAGMMHMRYIRRLAGASHPQHLPAVQGKASIRRLGLSGPALAPIIFLGVWLALLLRH